MGKIRNSLNMRIKGKVGAYSFYTASGNRQVVRPAQNDSNYGESARRSESQQERRARWGNLVNFYKANKNWMDLAFQTRKANQSSYNKFMSLNINNTSVYLTKEQCSVGSACAEQLLISQGTLAPITDGITSGNVVSNINATNTTFASGATIGSVSTSLLELNSNLQINDQITLVININTLDNENNPRLVVKVIEFTLEPGNTVLFSTIDPDGRIGGNGNMIGQGSSQNVYMTFILSRNSNNGLQVSTETLFGDDDQGIVNDFTSDEQKVLAIASYGVDTTSILTPGSEEQSAVPEPGAEVTVNVNPSPANGGTVAGSGDAVVGQTKTLTATAEEGYRFLKWSINGIVYDDNPLNLLVTGNMNGAAIFTLDQ